MKNDFRHYTFNSIFSLNDYSDKILLVDNDLDQNQLIRANQLIQNTNEKIDNFLMFFINSINLTFLSKIIIL